jgi:hypothetical protein
MSSSGEDELLLWRECRAAADKAHVRVTSMVVLRDARLRKAPCPGAKGPRPFLALDAPTCWLALPGHRGQPWRLGLFERTAAV